MEHEHLSLNDAYDLVKGRKSDISPNFSFMGQLLEFERSLNIPQTPSSASSSLSSMSSLEMEAFWKARKKKNARGVTEGRKCEFD